MTAKIRIFQMTGFLSMVAGIFLGFSQAADARALKVAVTSKPIHALVWAVMGQTGRPTLIVEGSASPHTFSLRPSAAQAIYQSDVVFRVSEGLEPFTRKIAESLPASIRFVSLADAPGVVHLPMRRGTTFEAHRHGDAEHDDGDHGGDGDADHDGHADSHAHEGEHERIDPHVWLDPKNAEAMVREVGRVLSAADPERGAIYAANADAVIARLSKLDGELQAELSAVKGRPFIVFHDATQYLERHFGLDAAGSITISPDVPPGARRLTEVRERIKSLGAVCVFSEPQFKPRLIAAVTEGTAARAAMLDPEGALLQPGPDLYFALMRDAAKSLVICLSGH